MARDLVKCVRTYRSLDDQIKSLNQQVYKLREDRKLVEGEMADLLKTADYATIHKLEIKDDNSVIKIQRPDMWSKPWSLSVKDLHEYLKRFWGTPLPKTAEECAKFIIEKRKNELIGTDFVFTRSNLKDAEDGSIV